MASPREQAIAKVQNELLSLYRSTGFQDILEDTVTNWIATLLTPPQDPWKVLGVDPNDPIQLIDQVWRLKAKTFHPDNPQTGNRDRFEMVLKAYQEVVALKAEVLDDQP